MQHIHNALVHLTQQCHHHKNEQDTRGPLTFVFPILSEPAKSTKFSFDSVYLASELTRDRAWKQRRAAVIHIIRSNT